MTHTKVWFSCDNCGADTHHESHAAYYSRAKKQAEELGWVVNTRRSYCPDCKHMMKSSAVKRMVIDLSQIKSVSVFDIIKEHQTKPTDTR